eukprot:3338055-Prorocentrum_lima.AAC.1
MATIARPRDIGDTSLEDPREDIASCTDTGPLDVQCPNFSAHHVVHTTTSRLVGSRTLPTLKGKR